MTPQVSHPDVVSDDKLRQLADQDECVVNRLGPARGTVVGILLSVILWAGLILTSAALFLR